MQKIHFITHEPFEGPGVIAEWAATNGFEATYTETFKNPIYPEVSSFNWLVVMGGGMSTYDDISHPWLLDEKAFIKEAINQKKVVVGICLGAQLIADVLDARVYKGPVKEIGWYPVNLTAEARQHTFFSTLPATITVFHWHGDTFTLPKNAIPLAYSKHTPNQAFLFENRVLGLQFHFEVTPEIVKQMVEATTEELSHEGEIQSAGAILSELEYYRSNRNIMHHILDKLKEHNENG